MERIRQFIASLEKAAHEGVKREITGRNALVRDLFGYLFRRTEVEYQFLLLRTKKGLILDSFSPDVRLDLAGCTVAPDFFAPYQDLLSFQDNLLPYTLIWAAPPESSTRISQLMSSLKMLLSIFDANRGREEYLLNCFNAVENAICIYDKNACLLYGNDAYFNNMQIFDKESVIGMNINDITEQSKIKVQYTRRSSSSLKMMDVLKSGKKTLDWKFSIESQTSPNKAQFVSVNMYPVTSRSGKVDGMIEISSSHQVSLNKTKALMGLNAEYTFDSIIGQSPAITQVIEEAKEYAASPYNLLIVGESGVGKELFAQAIHNHSPRKNEPFVALNCANFPENLIESELFGYVGGAFTGASKNGQVGKFELADGGTLFLDEIGELPLHFQSKLLRVLETRKITRIGSSTQTPVDVRVLAATNRDLEKMIEEGLFRKDLYYRLQVLNIFIPPLKDRKDDLLLLTDAFLRQAAEMSGEEPKQLDRNAQKCLMEYSWPGNVRELKNVIQRVSLLAKSGTVTRDILESAIYAKGYALQSGPSESDEERLNRCLADVDNAYAALLSAALEISGGNKKQAAEMLGVSRQTFYRMLEKYGAD